jgi:UDP-2,4-diacetamido-2,4,6-trideoxy-beta-L-altropyranose hydrolase
VIRCLALAERCLKAGDRIVLAAAELPSRLRQRVVAAGIEPVEVAASPGSPEDARRTAEIAHAAQAAWVVADGYRFTAAYQRAVRAAGLRLLLLDDFGQIGGYDADLILDQNLGASPERYHARRPDAQLLLGPKYVLLRRQFTDRDWPPREAASPPCRVLVTLGGGDSRAAVHTVIRGLADLPADVMQEAVVVLGPATVVPPSLRKIPRFRVCRNVADMAAVMAETDLAIAGGGTTAWELAFMGVPSLFVALADNQIPNCERLDAAGAGTFLGWHTEISPTRIREAVTACAMGRAERGLMAQRGRTLIDGRGSGRVWLHLHEDRVRLREATADDARLLWEWSNDPEVRTVSFSPDSIPWEAHLAWFAARRADPACRTWIGEASGAVPVGQVRFDLAPDRAVISMSLATAARGRHLGSLLIWTACRRLFAERPEATVLALIKPENVASIRAFAKAGFAPAGEQAVRGGRALAFTLRREQVAP